MAVGHHAATSPVDYYADKKRLKRAAISLRQLYSWIYCV
jgi:hypothetical protein